MPALFPRSALQEDTDASPERPSIPSWRCIPTVRSSSPIAFTNRWCNRPCRPARNRLPQARSGAAWYEKFDEKTRARKRQEGRQLFALALQYVTKPEEREHILTRARELGYRYGKDSVQYGVSLVDTLKAIMFFRQALLDTLEAGGDMQNGQTPASVRVTHGVEEFTMEVLYATVDGYERTLRNALVNQGAS